MRRIKHPPLRNKLDVADTQQVRLLKKRLGVSADDLLRTVEKVGNSIAAVSKEVELGICGPTDDTGLGRKRRNRAHLDSIGRKFGTER